MSRITWYRLILALLVVTLGLVPNVAAQTVTIRTPLGEARGVLIDSVRVFKGLRYAEPPSGEWRWKAPRPAARWQGLFNATQFGPACVQSERGRPSNVVGDEDCLRVNVWTPVGVNTRRPVLFYVHGGSFVGGSGANVRIDGATLAKRGVVVVTINYRLGILGFLGHPELSKESGTGSGNYGLLDIVEALRWVNRNIDAFGGDPENVTIMGMSAGASALSMIMPSRLARGLFHKAFLQSPGSFRAMGQLHDAESFGLGLGQTVAQLRAMPAPEVLTLFRRPEGRSLTSFQPLRPVVDGYVLERPEAFGFTQGFVPAVPVMLSSAADEGAPFSNNVSVNSVAELEQFVRSEFGADADEVLTLYAAKEDAAVKRQLAQLIGDTQFGVGARNIARAMERSGVHRAIFTRRAGGVRPAVHGSDTPYPFGNVPEAAEHPVDRALSELMMSFLVNFMQTGNPNAAGVPEWPRWSSARNEEMEFGDVVRVRETVESPGVGPLASIMGRRLGFSAPAQR